MGMQTTWRTFTACTTQYADVFQYKTFQSNRKFHHSPMTIHPISIQKMNNDSLFTFSQSVEEHMQLSFSHIMKHWKRNQNQGSAKMPGSRNVLLRFYPPQSANIGKLNHTTFASTIAYDRIFHLNLQIAEKRRCTNNRKMKRIHYDARLNFTNFISQNGRFRFNDFFHKGYLHILKLNIYLLQSRKCENT